MTRRLRPHPVVPACGLLLFGLLFGAACSDAPERAPILLVGVDGMEWDVALPLLQRGELPNLAALMEGGHFGYLETIRPTFSPIIWTSMATGKHRDQHGIRGFVRRDREARTRRIFNSFDRRTKAFWNILSDAGKSVAVVGWWMTYPVEEINGVMVAQVNTLAQANRKGGKNILKGGMMHGVEGQVYPTDRLHEFLDLHREVSDDLAGLEGEIFGTFAHTPSSLTARLWDNTRWAFRSDVTYLRIAERLAEESYDLLAVYFGGTDVVAHRFWRHMRPELYADPPPAEEIEDYGTVIQDYYRYVDEGIGRLVGRLPPESSVLVVSDHGMKGVAFDREFAGDQPPKSIRSGHHGKAQSGVIIVSGPSVSPTPGAIGSLRPADLERVASIYDVTPTILAMLGIPVGEDMVGNVLGDVIGTPAGGVRTVSTHDTAEWQSARSALDPSGLERAQDEERLEQLRALGYIN